MGRSVEQYSTADGSECKGKTRDEEPMRDNPLMVIYRRLHDRFGPQRWWPGQTPFEVIVGAILTQNTNWTNVEKAIGNLRDAGALSPKGLHALAVEELAELIRPAGYYNVKARRLASRVSFGCWGIVLTGGIARVARRWPGRCTRWRNGKRRA